MAREVGKIKRFLGRGITAANHRHILPAIKETIAGGASGNAETAQLLLTRNAKPAGLRAGGDDQRFRDINIAGIAHRAEGPAREINGGDHILHYLGAAMGRLRGHLVHQPRALNGLRKAWVVFHIGGDGQLPAWLHPGHQQGRKPRARRVDGRRIARRPGTQNEKLALKCLGHDPHP